MTREAAATDFHVDVDGVGHFVFAKRTMRDELRISAEYSRLTEGVENPADYLAIVANWMSTLKVLTVAAPGGWDVETMDPLDDETYTKLMKVFTALREKEGSFRRKPGQAIPGEGAANGAVGGVLVPPQIQPGANG